MHRRKIFSYTLLFLLLIGIWSGIKWYKTPNYLQGDVAPDFIASTTDGDSIKLSDFKGKIILLDFWGSWCEPCRVKNKELVETYDKYKNAEWTEASGFEIISVGIEKRKANWTNAIQKNRLSWKYHVSDLKYFEDPVAKLYGVVEIPAIFVINEDGVIVGVNLEKRLLHRLLDSKLSS